MPVTSIEWTEATWNPIAGCSLHSPGCTNCYAMRTAARLATIPATASVYAGLTQPSKAGPVWTGKIAVNESTMLAPLKRKKPTMYFVNSMSDLFHESVPDGVIDRVFAVMEHCRQHTFQVLTKRSDRMRAYLTARKNAAPIMVPLGNGLLEQHPFNNEMQVPPHIWLGVSVEDQKRADECIPDLLATPAAVRFLSCEPLLGPVDLRSVQAERFVPEDHEVNWKFDCLEYGDTYWYEGHDFIESGDGPLRDAIDWVIAGGESGPGTRPMHPDWARSLRDQCAAAGVPFFFKQWGEWMPLSYFDGFADDFDYRFEDGSKRMLGEVARNAQFKTHEGQDYGQIGKKRAGRLLDGVTHDAMPQVQAHA